MKKCSLCGGTLDQNRRCTFCGLDNTKNDDLYKHLINQSSCEDRPLTHVHTESTKSEPVKTYSRPTYTGQKRAKNASKTGVAKVVSIIVIIVTLISSLYELFENIVVDEFDYSYSEEVEYDPYEYVVDTLPEEGHSYSVTLEPGIYTVGAHILEGTYKVEVVTGDYGMIEINDYYNSIYLYENIGYEAESTEMGDLRLYQNAYFIVGTGIVVQLSSENVHSLELERISNPITESVKVTKEMVAGEDFPAGIYDISYTPSEDLEYGYVNCYVSMGGYNYDWNVFFDEAVGSETYHNVVLPEGTVVELEDLDSVLLIPCAEIFTIDAKTFYETF